DHVVGVDEVRALADDFSPESVADYCGVPADEIRTVARELAAATSGVVYGRMGTSTVEFGTVGSWLVDVVNVLTGNLDSPGGAMFPQSPVSAALAEEIETPGEGQARAVVTIAGNPVLSAPDGDRLSRALEGVDFMLSIDP